MYFRGATGGRWNVCLWHKADIETALGMSAFGGKADIAN
jgi:hypothetical protein